MDSMIDEAEFQKINSLRRTHAYMIAGIAIIAFIYYLYISYRKEATDTSPTTKEATDTIEVVKPSTVSM